MMPQHVHQPVSPRRPQRRRGFTLVELMVSVVIALLLMLAIAQVFRMSSTTIGTGAALSEAMRNQRGVYTALRNDIQGYSGDALTGIMNFTDPLAGDDAMPFMTIRSQRAVMFQDRDDKKFDVDFAASGSDAAIETIDLNDDGVEGDTTVTGENVSLGGHPWALNRRSHRVDTVSFFSRGSFRRQTGQSHNGVEDYVSDMNPVPQHAYIWYGHLRLPQNPAGPIDEATIAATYRQPGERDPANTTPPEQYNPNNYFASDWVLGRVAILINHDPLFPGRTLDSNLKPLIRYQRGQSVANSASFPANMLAPFSVGSVARLGENPQTDNNEYGLLENSWFDLADADMGGGTLSYRGVIKPQLAATAAWWQPLLQMSASGPALRFAANPQIKRPLTPLQAGEEPSKKLAMTVPYLMGGCVQFAVEFAGDFVTQYPEQQANFGQVFNSGSSNPDGVPDFVGRTINNVKFRETRWYGLERDSDGDGVYNPLLDVMPVSTFRGGATLPFEKEKVANTRYTCAWGAHDFDNPAVQKPTMMRIIIGWADKNGRLSNGYQQEYVFRLRQ